MMCYHDEENYKYIKITRLAFSFVEIDQANSWLRTRNNAKERKIFGAGYAFAIFLYNLYRCPDL